MECMSYSIFIDDITIVSQDHHKITLIKDNLWKFFKIKDLRPISYLLGIKIDYDQANCTLQLSQ